MRILTDVDGVVADLVGGICRELTAAGHQFTPNMVTDNEFARCMSPDQAEIAFAAMARPGFCESLDWYPGAQSFVSCLQHVGELVAVTKPFKRGRTWAWERAQWLGDIPVVSTARKDLVAGDVLIEDLPENMAGWLEAHPGKFGVLIDRPWNRHLRVHPRATRARGYFDAWKAVRGWR